MCFPGERNFYRKLSRSEKEHSFYAVSNAPGKIIDESTGINDAVISRSSLSRLISIKN